MDGGCRLPRSLLYSIRWPILCLYLVLPFSALLFGLILTPFDTAPGNVAFYWISFSLFVGTQVLYTLCGLGWRDFARPLQQRRLGAVALFTTAMNWQNAPAAV